MVDRAPALLVLVPLEHREVGHPEEGEERRRRSGRARDRDGAAGAPSTREVVVPVVGGEEQRLARPRARAPRAPPRRGTSRSASGSRRVSSRMRYARPLAPRSFATSSSVASSARENAWGTRRKRTASAPAKTPNSEPRVASVASSSSRPNRMSGLSDAEAPVGLREGHAAGTASGSRCRGTRARSARTSPPSSAKSSSRSGKHISTSSCVISCTRSARRSSSRKQIAIW